MNWLKRIRCEVFRITQAEMASIAGVRQATVSRWEAGITGPSLRHIRRIRNEARKRKLRWDDRFLFVEGERAA